MIWATSIWKLEYSNRSKIHSAQKCYLCLRYVVSPMCPGRTLGIMVGAKGFEPSTSWSRTRRASQAALPPARSAKLEGKRERKSKVSIGVRYWLPGKNFNSKVNHREARTSRWHISFFD